jgi:hypothetical protein
MNDIEPCEAEQPRDVREAVAEALFWRRLHGALNAGLFWFGPPGLFFAVWGVGGFLVGMSIKGLPGLACATLPLLLSSLARAYCYRGLRRVIAAHFPKARAWGWSDGGHRCAVEFGRIEGGGATILRLEERLQELNRQLRSTAGQRENGGLVVSPEPPRWLAPLAWLSWFCLVAMLTAAAWGF